MATTSLKLPDDVKERVVIAAQEQGVTAHAFMVEAIRQATLAAERRSDWVAEAMAAREAALQSGEGHAADEVHGCLRQRIAGTADVKRPVPRAWRR